MASVPSKVQAWQQALAPTLARWGTYCASNQIKVLLIDCLVFSCIVCLVWPFDILPQPWAAREGAKTSTTLPHSVQQLWNSHNIDASDNPMCLKTWPVEHQLHLVQVVVESGTPNQLSEHGMLDRQPLHQALLLQKSLSQHFLQRPHSAKWQCVSSPSDSNACLMVSPLEAWHHQEAHLLSDPDLLATLATSPHLDATLGHLRHSPQRQAPQSADEIIFTFFLKPPRIFDGVASLDEVDVQAKLQAATAPYGTLVLPPKSILSSGQTKVVIKPFQDHHHSQDHDDLTWNPLADPTVWGYFFVAMYVGYTMRRMDRVHSRPGLLFTAFVTMGTSTLLSLSVCKILRFSVDGIPWKLIPLLITVLAVDNTFVLTHAVVSTPVEWPIAQRVGQGLAKVGPSMFLALVVEHILLFTAWGFIPIRSVREMVLLAAVALKADAAMQITLFLPVLSIDIQRLELSDLLRLGSTHPVKLSDEVSKSNEKQSLNGDAVPAASYAELLRGIWDGAKDRIARSITFLVIFILNFGMYWTHGANYFLPPFCQDFGALNNMAESVSSLWSALNPSDSPVVHLSLSRPSHLFLGLGAPSPVYSLASTVFQDSMTLILSTLVPSITATASLYFFLQYLLKDQSFLEAEKAKAAKERQMAAKAAAEAKAPRAEGKLLDFKTATDIELIASSASEAPVIAFWAVMQPHITICRPSQQVSSSDITQIELPKSATVLQHLAVDKEGRFCAAADRNGEVYVWELSSGTQLSFQNESKSDASADLAEAPSIISLFSGPAQTHHAPPLPGQAHKVRQKGVVFYAARSDGSLDFWNCLHSTKGQIMAPLTDLPKRVRFHFLEADDTPASSDMAFARNNAQGAMEIWRRISDGSWAQDATMPTQLSDGGIQSMTLFTLAAHDQNYLMAVTGSTKGLVTIWEQVDSSWHVVAEIVASSAPVRQIRVLTGFNTSCDCSPALPNPGFVLAYETAGNITFQRLFKAVDESQCRCTSLHRRVRSDSEASEPVEIVEQGHASHKRSPLSTPKRPSTNANNESGQIEPDQSVASILSKADASPNSNTPRVPSNGNGPFVDVPSAASTVESSIFSLRTVESRSIPSDASGFWEQMGKASVVCGVQKSSKESDVGSWHVWSVDLQGPDKLFNKCLVSEIIVQPSAAPTRASSPTSEQERPSSVLRNRRKVSPRRRGDPLDVRNTTQEQVPQLFFSRIRAVAKAGSAVAATYGNNVILIEPPPRQKISSTHVGE